MKVTVLQIKVLSPHNDLNIYIVPSNRTRKSILFSLEDAIQMFNRFDDTQYPAKYPLTLYLKYTIPLIN